MGLFCVNFHFRDTEEKALTEALDRRGVTEYRIVQGKGGWTALYEEQASEQDDRRIHELAGGLSKDLQVAVISFLVHDSDIACYWLYDNGELLDEYNSDPDYFGETDGPKRPSGSQPNILARYCREGVKPLDLARILSEKNVRATTFAEHLIEQLAGKLGIDRGLAIADYRHIAEGEGPFGPDGFDDDGGEDDDGPGGAPLGPGLMERLAKRFGFDTSGAPADPQATAMVQAAAKGDTAEIDRLLAAGVPLDAEAPAPLPGKSPMAGLAQFFPAGLPQMVMTPLLAAIANKQRQATERLLDAGANPNRVHQHYGTAVHAAAGAGETELLQLLLDRGADLNARNARGQTPLQMVTATRQGVERLLQMQETMKSMGMRMPPQMANVSLPTQGWEACERLLKSRGAE